MMKQFPSSKQAGFTLVELIVVIVVLGILAATALPKFVNVSQDARRASVEGLTGALRSSVSLVQAKYYAAGNTTATTVTMQDGSTVAVAAGTGIPAGTAAGIGAALQSLDGFTPDYASATAVTFRPTNGGSATCQVTYNGTTGLVGTPTTSGC
jgi:MSHA pilin protein MshA